MPRHALLDDETVAWIESLGQTDLSDGQRMALAMMRLGTEVSNETLRGWGLHRADATTALTDLVRRNLACRNGGRRYATYSLVAPEPRQPRLPLADVEPLTGQRAALAELPWLPVLQAMRIDEPTSMNELRERTGLTYAVAVRRVNELIGRGWLTPTAPARSKNRAYLLTLPVARLAPPHPRARYPDGLRHARSGGS